MKHQVTWDVRKQRGVNAEPSPQDAASHIQGGSSLLSLTFLETPLQAGLEIWCLGQGSTATQGSLIRFPVYRIFTLQFRTVAIMNQL